MAGEDLKNILFLCALQNAVKHGGVPQAGAVVGMVMSAHPEFRPRAKEVATLAKEAVADVAALSADDRVTQLQARAPEMYDAIYAKHEHRKVLPDLESADHGVVMRLCAKSFRAASYWSRPCSRTQRCIRQTVWGQVHPAY